MQRMHNEAGMLVNIGSSDYDIENWLPVAQNKRSLKCTCLFCSAIYPPERSSESAPSVQAE
jgi:hypothetical protein